MITTGATVACSLQGQVVVANSGPVKLLVGGEPVALQSGVSSWTVQPGSCTATNPAGGSPSPCTSVAAPTAGVATKLVVGGVPVLLETLSAPSVGSAVPPPAHAVSVQRTSTTTLQAV
ncbi:hypothetical protein [Frankia sp. CcWB2]